MGIFSRISDIFRANINDLIDRAEDPEKMVRQIIIDMQKELNQSIQALGKASASEQILKKQYQSAVSNSADWEEKAKTALSAGNVESAKKALTQKVKADEQAAAYQEMAKTVSQQIQEMQEQTELLKAKLEEAKNREALLTARSQVADSRKNTSPVSGAEEQLNRMEEKIARKEAEAEAFSKITQNTEFETLAQLQTDAKVDTELQRLLKEINPS